MADTGLLLAHAVAPELAASDADLISGMLTAIRDFVADSFSREREAGGLRRFSVGELTVMVEQGPQALIAAVVRGEAPDSLLPQLQDTLETIHLQFAGALADFDGDTAPFAPARPLLEECLATVVATDRGREGRRRRDVASVGACRAPSGARARRARAAGAAALGPGGGAAPVGARHRAHPGRARRRPLALRRAARPAGAGSRGASRRAGGGYRARGAALGALPLAPSRTGAGASPAEPVAAGRREAGAVRGHAPGDGLRSAGLGSVGGDGLRHIAPGVSALDLSGVASEMPEALTRLKREIEGERVLFAVGSAALGATARSIVTRVAEKFRRLEAGAAALGTRATLELVGRTDPTGSDAANQALSRDRAEAVLAALAARGVPRSRTRVNALGTSRPLPGDDPADRARINRSVSFGVGLGPEPGREPSR